MHHYETGELMSGDGKFRVMPFYLLCDVSYSMADGGKIGAVNRIVPEIRAALLEEPTLADMAFFSLITFSDSATVRIPLQNLGLTDSVDIPELKADSGTNFGAAFRAVKAAIEEDSRALKSAGDTSVHRPTVFFLTDGQDYSSDTPEAFRDLTHWDGEKKEGNPKYPLLVPFGIGDADVATLSGLCWPRNVSKYYAMTPGASAAEAIHEITRAITFSVINSARSILNGAPEIQLPTAEDLSPNPNIRVGQFGDDGDTI
jgi:uncharacterized protein YegL